MKLLTALGLCAAENKAILVRMRYDFGRELVLVFSSATLLALFYYIFHDFLNQKLASIPGSIQSRLIHLFLVTVLQSIGLVFGSRIRAMRVAPDSWKSFALRLGEEQTTIKLFMALQCLFLGLLFYGIFWMGIVPSFERESPGELVPWMFPSLGLAALTVLLGSPGERAQNQGLRPILADHKQARKRTLLVWRWYQLSRRNNVSRLCLGLAAGFFGLSLLLAIGSMPPFLLVLTALVAGLLLASAVAFQLEEDMRSIWFERQTGCSHEEYVATYQQLCVLLSVGLAACYGLLLLTQPTQSYTEIWKTLPIAALCPLLMPSIMFQLAPERPMLQIMVLALLGLFLGTAIYAHALGLLLIPLVIHYAKQYQKGNFYRA